MTDATLTPPVAMGFEARTIRVTLADIEPLRPVTDSVRRSRKYAQIAASICAIGIVEPLIIIPRSHDSWGKYLLLDGHLRFDALKAMGETHTLCLLARNDESFTYNSRISRLSTIREHRMILTAIERGVSPERLATALNVDVGSIKRKSRLLDGICAEAAALLEDKHLPVDVFRILKGMQPLRQIEAAELMVAMNRFTISYAQTLLAATPNNQRVPGRSAPKPRGLTAEQQILMQRESANFERQFKLIEQTYGADQFDFVLAKAYVARLVRNPQIGHFLKLEYQELFAELNQIADDHAVAA